MKKIIIVFESVHYDSGIFNFISALNTIEPLSLTAIFLSPVDYTSIWAFPVVPGSTGAPPLPGSKEAEEKLAKNIEDFKARCKEYGIRHAVHNDVNGVVFETVRTESRFADLMIIDTGVFYKDFGEQPNDYLKEVMHITECPVLLIPPDSGLPQTIMLMYDGSESSMFAIRQFAYVFPVLSTLKTVVVYVHGKDSQMPEERRMKSLVQQLYPNVSFQIFRDEKHYHTWFEDHPHPLIVTGAYGRPAIVEFLRKSFLTDIINDQQYFVFLAHK